MFNLPTLDDYLALIPSQHSDKPKFVELFTQIANSYLAVQNVIAGFIDDFDVDEAIGAQLDAVGLWVGVGRVLKEPITGVFFTFDSDIIGETWDTGVWGSRFDPSDTLYILNDNLYRLVIRLKIMENIWDGSIPSLYAIWDAIFGSYQVDLYIQDNQDMTFDAYFISSNLTEVEKRLIENSGLFPKPAGVTLNYIFSDTPPV